MAANIHLDAAISVPMGHKTIESLVSWCNAAPKESQRMMATFRQEIAVECSFELSDFEIIFTSGASESNCHIIMGAVRSFASKTGRMPHVIISAAEHKSILTFCAQLEKEKFCHVSVLTIGHVGPYFGIVDPASLIDALRPNTCIVSIIAANHDTGIVGNIRELTKITHDAKVPFHTDAAQLFGKSPVRPNSLGVDAFSVSFHKLGGPPGIGALIIRKVFMDGYDLSPHITRDGTGNIPGIGASFTAFQSAMQHRGEKNARLIKLRAELKSAIASRIKCFNIADHAVEPLPLIDERITKPEISGPAIFWIAPTDDSLTIPNIVLMAVKKSGFCNRTVCANLAKVGLIVNVSISIAPALRIHSSLRRGLIQVGFNDQTTLDDVRRFVQAFIAALGF